MKSLLRHIGDAGEYVGKPSARVNAVQLGGLDQAVHGGGALPTLVGTSKEPSLSYKGRSAQHAFGGVIRQARPSSNHLRPLCVLANGVSDPFWVEMR